MTSEQGMLSGGGSFVVAVSGCARCSEDHDAVEFREFANGPLIAEHTYTHWGLCPKTREPILNRIVAIRSYPSPPESDVTDDG